MKNADPVTAAHELGHNFGLEHSARWLPSEPLTVIGPGPLIEESGPGEYANFMDVMGSRGGPDPTDPKALHFNVYQKSQLHWLPDSNIDTVGTSRVVRLYAMDNPDAAPPDPLDPSRRVFDPTRDMAIRLGRGDGLDYWIGYRNHSGWSTNPWVRDGLEVVWPPQTLRTGNYSTLLDIAPETPDDVTDAPLVLGRTFSDEVEGLHITPLAADPVSRSWIDVQINFFKGDNQAPVLSAQSTAPGNIDIAINPSTGFATANLTATAQDGDGDSLTYSWEFDDITAQGNSTKTLVANVTNATKSWSRVGEFRGRVIVSDRKGMTTSRSWLVRVSNGISSHITGKVVDALGNGLQGVFVSQGGKGVLTDADGSYRMSLAASAAALPVTASKPGWTFTAPGYASVSDRVVLSGPDTVGIDFRGTGSTYRISGNVSAATSDPEFRAPARGVLVRAGPALVDPGSWTLVEPTDPFGNFSLFVENGTYGLRFEHNGALVATRTARVDFGNIISVDVEYGASTQTSLRPGVAPNGQAAAEPVTRPYQTSTWLTISGTDPDGPADALRYDWYEADGRNADIFFPNDNDNTNSAKRILVGFRQPGTYRLRATIGDATGAAYGQFPEDTGTEVVVTVGRILSSVLVLPPGDRVAAESSKQYSATPIDQFGQAMSAPTTWLPPVAHGTASAGTITPSGLYTAPNDPGRVSVKADLGGGIISTATADVLTAATVSDRRVFYHRSPFEGNPDDVGSNYAARATDKSALLPGQSISYGKYTSYSKGINGIIVDIGGLWANVTAADFVFRAGNNGDIANWASGPAPANVRVLMIGSLGRVSITWPDYNPDDPNNPANAVANKWLQVTVLANHRTGLASPHVFYFGNLIGDTELHSTGAWATLAEDYSATRAVADDPNQNAALIESHYDHNRDGIHDEKDYDLVQKNYFRMLYLLAV